MNEKIRNYLGIAIIIVVLVIGYASLSYVMTYSRVSEPTSFRSFDVSGTGKSVGVPDVAQFNFSIITEGGSDLASLQSANTEKTNKAIDYVKSQGVDKKDITTEGYNINPRYQYYDCTKVIAPMAPVPGVVSQPNTTSVCPPPSIVGYTITQSVQVKVRDFTKVGNIMYGVVKNGANSVSSLAFQIDDPTQVQSQARAQAIEKAKAKAEDIAKAGGFKLGRLLSIDESNSSPSPYPMNYGITTSVPMMEKSTPTIEPGSQDVNVTVTLKYEID